MTKLLILPTGSGQVTQCDFENILTIDAEIERRQRMRQRIAASILERIAKGADVEEGSRTYHVETDYDGSTRVQTLQVR